MVDEDQDLSGLIRDHVEALEAGKPVTPDEARARAITAWKRHRRRRHLMVAAAVLILLAAAGLFVRTSFADDTAATAGRPIPRDLWELADRVAGLPTTVLGETDDARYTYRRGTRSTDQPTSEVASDIEEMWVSIDGGGRQVLVAEDNPTQTSEGVAGPDLFTVDGVPVRTFLQLPDDADAVAAAFITHGKRGFTTEVSPLLVDALSYTGLPGPARAGALRALDVLGMVPVPDADPGPHLLRVAGPRGPDGSKLQADFDVRTGRAVAWELYGADGEVTRFATIEVDLRQDSQRRP